MLAASVLLCPDAAALGISYWHLRNYRARAALQIEKVHGATDAYAAIRTRSDAAPSEATMAVVDAAGTRVPFKIVANGPGDRVVVAFRLTQLLNYYIYLDPAAQVVAPQRPEPEWEPRSGVLLRTFAWGLDRANLNTMKGFRELVRASKAEYGGGYRDAIFQGPNPFGPSTQYVSVYTAYLKIEEPGRYEFCTNSDDASVLYVDGKLTAEYLGWHGASAVYGQKNGTAELGAGVHRIDYYHAEDHGAQACVAGWKKPGDKYPSLIPPEAFVPIVCARVIRYHEQFGSLPDFRARVTRVYTNEEGTTVLVGVRFEAVASGMSQPYAYRWAFGDGETGAGKSVEHVYLTQGTIPVTLEIDDKLGPAKRVRHWIGVWHLEERNTQEPRKTRTDFEAAVAPYTIANHPTASLETLDAFYKLDPAMDSRRMRVCQELVRRLKATSLARAHDYAFELADLYETLAGGETLAVRKEILESILAQATSEAHKARAHFELGELLLFYERNAQDAITHFEAATGLDPPEALAREALIRIGDAYLELGRTEDARQAYRAVPVSGTDRKNAAILSEGYGLSVERALAGGDNDAALETINTWEWRLPEVRMAGYSSLLRVRVAVAQQQWPEARKYCRLIVDKLDEDAYKPEAYAVLIRLLLRDGARAQALARYNELVEQFPLSSEAKDLAALFEQGSD